MSNFLDLEEMDEVLCLWNKVGVTPALAPVSSNKKQETRP